MRVADGMVVTVRPDLQIAVAYNGIYASEKQIKQFAGKTGLATAVDSKGELFSLDINSTGTPYTFTKGMFVETATPEDEVVYDKAEYYFEILTLKAMMGARESYLETVMTLLTTETPDVIERTMDKVDEMHKKITGGTV